MTKRYREALRHHIAAIDGRRPQNGHSERGFATCPHPDCRAVHFGDVFGGQFYGRTAAGGLVPIGTDPPDGRVADFWICRRVADFPGARVPVGGAVASCSKCNVAIVFNPRREGVTAPKVCMQCAHIQPLPIES